MTRLAGALVLLALALRLGAVGVVDFHSVDDPRDYIRMGESIADHGRFPPSNLAAGPTATRAPLYPIVVGGVFAVTGDSVTAVRIFGALLGTLAAILTGLLAAQLFTRKVGVIALALAAIAPPLILMSVTLMTETLFIVLALGALLVALRAGPRPSLRTAVAVGALAALATLSRPNGGLVLGIALLGLWRRPLLSVPSLRVPVVAGLTALVVFVPWTVRNERELHAFVPVTTSGWLTASGMFNDTTRTDPVRPAVWRVPTADPELRRIYLDKRDEGEVALTAALRAHTKAFLGDHPAYPAEAVARNLLRFAHVTDFDYSRPAWESVGLEAWPATPANLFFMVTLLLAIGGVLAGGLRAGPWWLWLAPVALAVSVAAVGTAVRYRVPVDPFVIVLAAYALAWVAARAGTARGEPGEDESLRVTTARGTMVNAAFQVGLAGLGLVRTLALAAFLTTREYGIWGIVVAALITLLWLKQVGIGDKYIQQRDDDQELAFQRAFTIEMVMSLGYFVLACVVLPIYALAYGRPEIILPGFVLALAVPLNTFQTPSWIALRRLDYARQRLLTSIDPVVSIVAMVILGALGHGYWGMVVGSMIGTVTGSAVCVLTSPYPLRWRFDRAVALSYASFSWPLLALGVSDLLTVQGGLLVANHAVGIAGVAVIALVTGIATFANRADGVVSQTIYPAVCRIADDAERMREVFLKSNRVALMWAMPFAAGLALFAGYFTEFVLGSGWSRAETTLALVAVVCGFEQLAFNWTVFMRALGDTKPLLRASLLNMAVFLLVATPAIIVLGTEGYAIGFAASTAAQVLFRAHHMRRRLGRFSLLDQTARAVAPVLPGVAVILLGRLAAGPASGPGQAIVELVVFVAVTAVSTLWLERALLRELTGYVRGRTGRAVPAA